MNGASPAPETLPSSESYGRGGGGGFAASAAATEFIWPSSSLLQTVTEVCKPLDRSDPAVAVPFFNGSSLLNVAVVPGGLTLAQLQLPHTLEFPDHSLDGALPV